MAKLTFGTNSEQKISVELTRDQIEWLAIAAKGMMNDIWDSEGDNKMEDEETFNTIIAVLDIALKEDI